MKWIYFFSLLSFFSCGSSPGNKAGEDTEIDGTDSIATFDMDETRLSAVDFNNELTLMQESILDQVETLFLSDSASVDLNLENTLFEIDLDIQSLKMMKTPPGGEAFVNAVLDLMDFYESELTNGFRDIVPLLKSQELTKKDQERLAAYDAWFVKQEAIWFDSIFVAQEKFAAANHIQLEQ